jgi:sortase A
MGRWSQRQLTDSCNDNRSVGKLIWRVAQNPSFGYVDLMSLKHTFIRVSEPLCWLAGLLLSGFFLSQMVRGEVQRVQDIEQVELAWNSPLPDQSLWAPGRIEAWQQSQVAAPANVMAVLEVPEVGLKVPVYAGASDLNMDRGAGHIKGTTRPDGEGNIGIAGHRDGYFRALKDVEVGDSLTLLTSSGQQRYLIDEILIVDPLDVEVLDASDVTSVTLVTCYPFYFVGHAPQRYIVKARLDDYL